jgi:hypothetical protein
MDAGDFIRVGGTLLHSDNVQHPGAKADTYRVARPYQGDEVSRSQAARM